MLSVKAREASDTIFKVFGKTQLRIKPSLPCFADECSNYKARKLKETCKFCGVRRHRAWYHCRKRSR